MDTICVQAHDTLELPVLFLSKKYCTRKQFKNSVINDTLQVKLGADNNTLTFVGWRAKGFFGKKADEGTKYNLKLIGFVTWQDDSTPGVPQAHE